MIKELLTKHTHKRKKKYKKWKLGYTSKKKHRDAVQVCRDGIRKVKAHLELNNMKLSKRNAKSCTWEGIIPCSRTDWGKLTGKC